MRLYRLLLRLFPASFRAEYGEQMCAIFAARRQEENAVALWTGAIFDLLINAVRAHADELKQDLRWTLRTLRQSPGFALTAISVMALGIGASTAAFTLLDYVLLKPLPYPHPEQLAILYSANLKKGNPRLGMSPPNFNDWRARSKSFSATGAYTQGTGTLTLASRQDSLQIGVAEIDSGVFRTLGVLPQAGRTVTSEDDRLGAPAIVLLSEDLANGLFGGAAQAVGRTIVLDGQTRVVAGVMPRGFAFPSRATDLWVPLLLPPPRSVRTNYFLSGIARLRPGVSFEQARAESDVIAAQLERAYPKANASIGATVIGMRDVISPQSRTLVLAIFGAAFCLLLIACANLANLLYARSLVRQREMAVRVAIGAGRERVLRQLLTETLFLAVASGALGLLLAASAAPLLARFVPSALPAASMPRMDIRVFAFAAAAIVLTSIVFGVGPALRACRNADLNALRLRSGSSRRAARLRTALVLGEVAATMMLLVGAGLLVKALWRVEAVNSGFNAAGILTLRTDLPAPKYFPPAARAEFYSRVLTQTRALPGVRSAAYTSFLPMVFGGGIFPLTVPGNPKENQVSIRFLTPDFFGTLGIPILRGRDFNERDTSDAPLVAVISDSLARRLWPGENPIGRSFNIAPADNEKTRTVVGVAGDVAVRGLEQSSEPQVYFPSTQQTYLYYYVPKDLAIRASSDAAALALAPAVRRIIHRADPQQTITEVQLLDEVVSGQTVPRREQLRTLGAFAAIAFLLAAIGIHGLLSFAVSARTQEIGVRAALGARRSDLVAMFLRQGLLLGAGGVAIAVPFAYFAARGMAALLFGVQPGDPAIYVSAAALALAMAIAGSLRPALRAASVDPAITIRAE